jgi:NAD(P)H-nitrite reductase large subunit
MRRYVIVGLGVAGVAAISELRRRDESSEIIMVGDEKHGFYSRPGLAYHLTGELPEKQLAIFSKKDWQSLNIHFVNAHATHLDPHQHQLLFGAGDTLTYDRLLLSTGSTAAPINVPGSNLPQVVKLDNLEDTRRILALARRVKTAVVVGGGILSLELVEGLHANGVRVHYFMRGGRYWPNILDEVESHMVEQNLEKMGIHLHFHTEIAEILGQHGKVNAVRTTTGEILPCGMVCVGIGVRSRMELAQEASLAVDKGILVNDHLQTSDVDIFAAGDVAQVVDPVSGKSFIDTLWTPAREKGITAAINMDGGNQKYNRPIATNVLRLAGIMTTIIGAVGSGVDEDLVSVARGSSETWLQLPNSIALESNLDVNHMRLMIGERNLLGAIVMGDQKLSIPLQELIAEETDISSIRDQLQPGAALGQILMDFWANGKGQGIKQ